MCDTQIDVTNQYLTFNMDDELFALEITRVREVMYSIDITKVPRMPHFYSGVVNLRGNVVSVIDLKLLLGIGQIQKTIDTCIIVVEVGAEPDQIQMGILADSVQEVAHFPPESVLAPPKIGTRLNADYIQGVGKQDHDFIIILDIEKILSTDNLAQSDQDRTEAR